jgi:hypothetical protein
MMLFQSPCVGLKSCATAYSQKLASRRPTASQSAVNDMVISRKEYTMLLILGSR